MHSLPREPTHALTSRARAAWGGPSGERHRGDRIGWLRAAVLGANDGIVSTASLVLGLAAAGADHRTLLLASLSGLTAGAMSMAAGEYVSVHSQRDTEQADLTRERAELAADPAGEQLELALIYTGRGLDPPLAAQVARALMARDALAAHARDELGQSDNAAARPLQAAAASAASFAIGALLPVAVLALVPAAHLPTLVGGSSLVFLMALGGLSAQLGGAALWPGIGRVAFWGLLAMLVTSVVGALFSWLG